MVIWLVLCLCLGFGSTVWAGSGSVDELVRRIEAGKGAEEALDELLRRGESVVPHLVGLALEGHRLEARGWAIVGLSHIRTEEGRRCLEKIYSNPKESVLVRTWAAAARLHHVKTWKELYALGGLLLRYPALKRPFRQKILYFLGRKEGLKLVDLLEFSVRYPLFQSTLTPVLLRMSVSDFVDILRGSRQNAVRRQAASYLAAIAQRGRRLEVVQAILKAYRFSKGAERVPWFGGALFLPFLSWKREEARTLVRDLLAWMVWAEVRGRSGIQKQIHNNLRSLELARVAGYRSPGWRWVGTSQWLRIWREAYGVDAVRSILREQGLEGDVRFREFFAE